MLCFLCAVPALSMITEFTPTLEVSEEYTDNYNRTDINEEEEFIFYLTPGFSLGFIEKQFAIDLSYAASYSAHEDHTEDDSWDHDFTLDGSCQITRRTSFIVSQAFSRSLTTELRTGDWREVDVSTTSGGITHQFGQNNSLRFDYTYEFNDHEESDADEYKSHNPTASLSYWFTPQFGIDSTLSYLERDFDLPEDDRKTITGEIRFIKQTSRHFQVYLEYAQTFIDQEARDHTTYHPSVGFDWSMTEDSGVSLGVGYIFNEWEAYDNDGQFFLDLDINKDWAFSRRCSLSLTGSSGYGDASADAASLGFNVYYEAAGLLSYQITRRLGIDFNGFYRRDEFNEPDVNRVDNTLEFGTGFIWSPYLWINIRLDYLFIDFETDSSEREDYQENRGTLTISLSPYQPMRFVP